MKDDLGFAWGTYRAWKCGNVLRCQCNMVLCRRESRGAYLSGQTRKHFRDGALFWMRCAVNYKQRHGEVSCADAY